ncbi:MAG: hypothetical protein HS111_35795, partial [Kofleriaceae bacterium]|nr:hypothetical protein [Kofleriaceae bacterium]
AAVDGFAATRMALVELAARWRLGELLGGDEGAALRAAAAAALAAEGVRDPARVVTMLAPVAAS